MFTCLFVIWYVVAWLYFTVNSVDLELILFIVIGLGVYGGLILWYLFGLFVCCDICGLFVYCVCFVVWEGCCLCGLSL